MVASYRLFCVLEINVALKEGKITTMFQLNDRRNKIFGSFRKAIGQLGKQLANFIAADEAKAEIQPDPDKAPSSPIEVRDMGPKKKRAWFQSAPGLKLRMTVPKLHLKRLAEEKIEGKSQG